MRLPSPTGCALLERVGAVKQQARLWRIPVCYEGEYAPDLAEVATRTGLDPDDVVRLHTTVRFHVYMLGFLPGFPYLGDLPERLILPRRKDPRLRVPAGSVAVATNLTAVYAHESPGGWHLIGRTPVVFFDAKKDRPSVLAPGDAVVFKPIGKDEFQRLAVIAATDARGHSSEALAP